MGQACSQRICCNADGAVDYTLPASARGLPTLQDEAAVAPKARYPTLLCSSCSGDSTSSPALQGKGAAGKDAPGPSRGNSPACKENTQGEDEEDGPEMLRLSARSAGYLEREADEIVRLESRTAAARNWEPYTFDSGAVYTGEWSGGMRHGQGRQVWPDGAVYEGEWKENCASGSGCFVHKDGDLFVGQWQDNVASGFGSYYHKAPELKVMIVGVTGLPDSGAYCTCEIADKPDSRVQTEALEQGQEAQWDQEVSLPSYALGDSLAFVVRGRTGRRDDDLLGRARLGSEAFHPEGFDGELPLKGKRGTRASLHVRVAAVRGAYRGGWENDSQSGYGVETWTEGWREGARYSGQFANGQKHGRGVYRWSDGSVYEGEWVNNVIAGSGTYTAVDGRCFKGQWRDSLIHGLGMYLWPGGRWYSGSYVFDQKHGFGAFHWPDGRKYEGFWANGKQDGLGRLTTKDGSARLSFWESGRRLSDVAESVPEADEED